MRAAKAEAFAQLRADYAQLKEGWGGAGDFDAWFSAELNNASLVAISTYRRWLPGLRWRLAEVGLPAFYREVESLLELEESERADRLEGWNAASTPGAVAQLR